MLNKPVELSIIIVNYKTASLVINCINSIYHTIQSVLYEIIVIDNNSEDEIVTLLAENYKDVIFVQSGCNVGFGAANNIGFKQAKGKYLLFLNSDTIVYQDVFGRMIDCLRKDERIGAIGITLTNKECQPLHSSGQFPKYLLNLVPSTKTPVIYANCKPVDVVMGADLMMPRTVFESVGLFDENIFLYEEEMELQFRMRLNGYWGVISQLTGIYHLEGKSSSDSFRQKCMFESTCYIIKKYRGVGYYRYYRLLKVTKALCALIKYAITSRDIQLLRSKQDFFIYTLTYHEIRNTKEYK